MDFKLNREQRRDKESGKPSRSGKLRIENVVEKRTAPFGQEFSDLVNDPDNVFASSRQRLLELFGGNPFVCDVLDNPKFTSHKRRVLLLPLMSRMPKELRARVVQELDRVDEKMGDATSITRSFMRGEIDEDTMRAEVKKAISEHGPATKRMLQEFSDDALTKEIQSTIEEKEKSLAKLQSREAHVQKLIKINEALDTWFALDHYVLEKNDCSRLHKLAEAAADPLDRVFNRGGNGRDDMELPMGNMLRGAKCFVVKHDWASAFKNAEDYAATDDPNDFRLPYNHCAFEFRVSGHTIIVIAFQVTDDDRVRLKDHVKFLNSNNMVATGFVEFDDVWFCDSGEVASKQKVMQFVWSQIRAICIALEAEVAQSTLVRAPAALNEERSKKDRPLLYDYHVVDLWRRSRSYYKGNGTHRSPRFHFRRGHWRHYTSHKTWIRWTIVGNPDIGVVDKEYSL